MRTAMGFFSPSKTIRFFFFFSLFCHPAAHSQSWDWVKNSTCTKNNWSTDIAVSPALPGRAAAGGVYFNDTLFWDSFIFPPYVFSSEGGSPTDCYLLSIDNNSLIQWAKKFGGIAEDYLSAVDMDEAGNSYSVGSFGDTLYVDDDTLPIYAPQGAYNDVFIIKHDSSGNLLWAKSIYGTWYEEGEDVHVFGNGGKAFSKLKFYEAKRPFI